MAHAHGFLDPVALLARIHRFAQPSEFAEPVELLRAGVIFHARGLINSRVIQNNLDWVWPYWIERQFSPLDPSFIPRAFSLTHVNLTHRNWTAAGFPDCHELPIVDPRGLLTPFLDGWSLDCWVADGNGRGLYPSREPEANCRQDLLLDGNLAVRTQCRRDDLGLVSRITLETDGDHPVCRLRLEAGAGGGGWLVVALRPQNPEGVNFIHKIHLSSDRAQWRVDDNHMLNLGVPADRHRVSEYRRGDVVLHLQDGNDDQSDVECEVGMASAAAMYRLEPGRSRTVTVDIPYTSRLPPALRGRPAARIWSDELEEHCRLQCPDGQFQFLYDAAIRSVLLHSPGDVYPGPYTYKRFWFRDAAFILDSLLCAGFESRVKRCLDTFPRRQGPTGYFLSQEGEWDANGEALWIMQRYCELSGRPPSPDWREPIDKGARWIHRKRMRGVKNVPHAGLLPAGFSAEHLGPSDYYYWDDFWGVAGLEAAAKLAAHFDGGAGERFRDRADEFRNAVDESLQGCAARLGRPAMPASPYRRLDAGAIGSIAAGYPLQLYPPDDPRLMDTVEFLLKSCFVNEAFFQDMVHSGYNAYLTLHVAQVLLRGGDERYYRLMNRVASLASSTGQWPEAIHPQTLGGCMGDGQHVWAAAEWLLLMRNCFVREEAPYRLVLCPGVPPHWLEQDDEIRFGPAPTPHGPVTVMLNTRPGGAVRVAWEAVWRGKPPVIEVALPGRQAVTAAAGENELVLE